MKDRKLDRLFDRFRKRGDTAALAQVFDATAPDLLGLAVHLVRDVGEGEDLVQQTFLTAIEKAERYDADRRLMPWLVGILVRHAHNARRKRERTQNDPLLDPTDRVAPVGDVEESELAASVTLALSGLSETYRAVLEPYLLRDERAVDIARASSKSPGTVRGQIRRGLDELRRALPVGLTLGAGVLLDGRSLANVRAAVLERAGRVTGEQATLGATSLSSTTLLGSLAGMNKLALGALAVALLSFVGWLALGGLDSTLPVLDEANAALEAPEHVGQLEPAALPNLGPAQAHEPERTERVELANNTPDPNVLEQSLAGASGRILDELGQPVVGLRVELLELRMEMFESLRGASLDGAEDKRWSPFVDEARTDAQGHFELWGADPAASHALGIDRGGERPTLRILDVSLPSGEQVATGDIELMPTRTVRGLVVDQQENPVAGARVRAALVPPGSEFLADLRRGAWLLFRRGPDAGTTVQVPASLVSLVDYFPAPTAQTDDQGRFELTGVPQAGLSICIDHEELPSLVHQLRERQTDLGSLKLPVRQHYKGRVVDSTGQGVADAQLLFGHVKTPRGNGREEAVSQGELRTNSDGSFQFDCVDQPTLFVRRNSSSGWTVCAEFTDQDEVVLDETLTARLHVTDRAGEPVTGAQFQVLTGNQDLMRMEMFLELPPTHGVVRELAGGDYDVSGLIPGPNNIRVMADGFALLNTSVELTAKSAVFELQLDRASSRQVRALDAGSGEPVEGCTVVIGIGGRLLTPSTRGVTEADGLVQLAGVPVEGEDSLIVRLAHPGYALQQQVYDPRSSETLEIKLSSDNEALFRITAGGREPTRELSITIELDPRAGGMNLPFPLLHVSDGRGSAVFENPPAGNWTYKIEPRFWNIDVMMIIASGGEAETYAKGEFTVRAGQRTIVDVDLEGGSFPDSRASAASGVEGVVDVRAGRELQLQVGVVAMPMQAVAVDWQDLGRGGAYSLNGLAPGEYSLLVGCRIDDKPDLVAIAVRPVTILRDRMLREDITLKGLSFKVKLLDEDGHPADDVLLRATPMDGSWGAALVEVVGNGVQRVTQWNPGRCLIMANSPEAGRATVVLEVTGVADEEFTVQLTRGVPCTGDILLPESTYDGVAWVSVRLKDANAPTASESLESVGGVVHLDMLGLVAGSYTGAVNLTDGHVYVLEFELPEGGDRDLEVHAIPMDNNIMSAPATNSAKSDAGPK